MIKFFIGLATTLTAATACVKASDSGPERAVVGRVKVITCYSGGQKIYKGRAEGRLEEYNHGFGLVDADTKKHVVVFGECVVETDQ